MELNLAPTFKDLFPGELADVPGLLEDIPSRLVLHVLAMLNAELFSNDKGPETQSKILGFFLGKQSPELRQRIIDNLIRHEQLRQKANKYLFTMHYNMSFMHYELSNFRDLPAQNFTIEQELQLFKAYFLVAQQAHELESRLSERPSPGDEQYFAKLTWPFVFDTFEVSQPAKPFNALLRGTVFLNYLQCHSQYSGYVKAFLVKHNRPNIATYIFDIINMLQTNYENALQGTNVWSSFKLADSPGFQSIFEQFNMDIAQYQAEHQHKKNYNGIKSKPLFRFDEHTWLVLNWNFVSNKTYEGLLFDFYQNSGIRQHPGMGSFPDFKRLIGGEITEGYLCRKLFNAAFRSKYKALLFDEGKIAGFPDAYYRKGNQIFLFEIKDVSFAADAINSYNYETIRKVIDTKINNPDKGTGQLIKQITKLVHTPFESRPGYKSTKNVEVFPIIVYADFHFNVPGINTYVDHSFRQQLQAKDLEKHYRKIHPLSLININFFIEYFDLLNQPNMQLGDLIKHYHQQIATRNKRFKKTHEMADEFKRHAAFEEIVKPLMKNSDPKRDYVLASHRALDIDEGLPNDNTARP